MYAEEMQNKTIMCCYYIPVSIPTLNTVATSNAGTHIVGEDVKWYGHSLNSFAIYDKTRYATYHLTQQLYF